MDEIISWLSQQLLPILANAGMTTGMSRLFGGGGGGAQRPQSAAPAEAPGTPTPVAARPDQLGVEGAGTTVRPSGVQNFGGGTVGEDTGYGGDTAKPVSSGFTTLTPSPFANLRKRTGSLDRSSNYV